VAMQQQSRNRNGRNVYYLITDSHEKGKGTSLYCILPDEKGRPLYSVRVKGATKELFIDTYDKEDPPITLARASTNEVLIYNIKDLPKMLNGTAGNPYKIKEYFSRGINKQHKNVGGWHPSHDVVWSGDNIDKKTLPDQWIENGGVSWDTAIWSCKHGIDVCEKNWGNTVYITELLKDASEDQQKQPSYDNQLQFQQQQQFLQQLSNQPKKYLQQYSPHIQQMRQKANKNYKNQDSPESPFIIRQNQKFGESPERLRQQQHIQNQERYKVDQELTLDNLKKEQQYLKQQKQQYQQPLYKGSPEKILELQQHKIFNEQQQTPEFKKNLQESSEFPFNLNQRGEQKEKQLLYQNQQQLQQQLDKRNLKESHQNQQQNSIQQQQNSWWDKINSLDQQYKQQQIRRQLGGSKKEAENQQQQKTSSGKKHFPDIHNQESTDKKPGF
jgi:hypothetical protein